MSLNAPLFYVIPDETVQVAKAAFPKGNRYLLLRDTFGPLFQNPDFAHLFSHTGQPAEDPARLALITILQFAERLSDEQAADAVPPRVQRPAVRVRVEGSVLPVHRVARRTF